MVRWLVLTLCGIAAVSAAAAQSKELGPALTMATVPLIKAELGPTKIRPADPGGFRVPHRDKTIYNNLELPRAKPGSELPANAGKKSGEAIVKYKIQLGIFHTTEAADRHWEKLRTVHGLQLGTLKKIVEKTKLNSGNIDIFRLQAGPVSTLGDGQKICSVLTARKIGCFVVKVT